jgi:hypothetical protein
MNIQSFVKSCHEGSGLSAVAHHARSLHETYALRVLQRRMLEPGALERIQAPDAVLARLVDLANDRELRGVASSDAVFAHVAGGDLEGGVRVMAEALDAQRIEARLPRSARAGSDGRVDELNELCHARIEAPRWSANGSFAVWQDGTSWFAPTARSQLPVDFVSPHALAVPLHSGAAPVGEWPFVSQGNVSIYCATMRAALDIVAMGWPNGISLVDDCTRAIVVTNGVDRDPLFLAESLVHEAVHSCCFALQRQGRWFSDMRLAISTVEHSPWTGDVLIVRNYVHACFVWFALYHFYRSLVDLGAEPAFIHDRLKVIRGGFTLGPLIDDGRAAAWGLSQEVVEAIRQAQSYLLSDDA